MPSILIIDDDDHVRLMLEQTLERAGYATIAVGDGKEALRVQREAPADLVLTDLIMPEKDGLETISEIRRLFPNGKIIAMSGGGRYGNLDFLPVAKKLGASRTLAKPFTREKLLETVREVLAM
jgi:DNA-binding NtrC family response regulator